MATEIDEIDLFDGTKSPGDVLRLLLESHGWSQEQLASITGKSRQSIAQILGGRAGISPEMAVVFSAAFGTYAADWLRLGATYRLAQVKDSTDGVQRRAKIHGTVPVKDIQKRGWIKPHHATLDDLEADLKQFLAVSSLDEEPPFVVATRRSSSMSTLTPSQRAWCARARQMAAAFHVSKFEPSKLKAAARDLRELAAYPKEARHVPKLLSQYGIRFVVVEPLPAAKIDGAAFWLKEDAPVIALSVRFDRIDTFWFTLAHEFDHILHGDALSVDVEMIDPAQPLSVVTDEAEDRANRNAANMLVPKEEIESFIRRVAPLYSKQRIVQFAHRIKIHPGVIVGQLQHRGEVGYSALREFLCKIRDVVTSTALTDGWGKIITPGMLLGG